MTVARPLSSPAVLCLEAVPRPRSPSRLPPPPPRTPGDQFELKKSDDRLPCALFLSSLPFFASRRVCNVTILFCFVTPTFRSRLCSLIISPSLSSTSLWYRRASLFFTYLSLHAPLRPASSSSSSFFLSGIYGLSPIILLHS